MPKVSLANNSISITSNQNDNMLHILSKTSFKVESLLICGSAEYSAEPLKKVAEYSVSAESYFGRFGKGSVSAESHLDRFGKDSVRPNLNLAGSVHH